jgi:hypothetical protein
MRLVSILHDSSMAPNAEKTVRADGKGIRCIERPIGSRSDPILTTAHESGINVESALYRKEEQIYVISGRTRLA